MSCSIDAPPRAPTVHSSVGTADSAAQLWHMAQAACIPFSEWIARPARASATPTGAALLLLWVSKLLLTCGAVLCT